MEFLEMKNTFVGIENQITIFELFFSDEFYTDICRETKDGMNECGTFSIS